MSLCPCGTNMNYADCCEPVINGNRIAVAADELMRARYSAHDKVAVDFLYNSTHPDHRTNYDHRQKSPSGLAWKLLALMPVALMMSRARSSSSPVFAIKG